MIKANFSASLFQFLVSHDPSVIITISSRNIFRSYQRWNFFRILWWIEKKQFCYIINVFTVTFDTFNASLLISKNNLLSELCMKCCVNINPVCLRYSHSAEVQVRLQFLTCVFSTLGSPDHFSEHLFISHSPLHVRIALYVTIWISHPACVCQGWVWSRWTSCGTV